MFLIITISKLLFALDCTRDFDPIDARLSWPSSVDIDRAGALSGNYFFTLAWRNCLAHAIRPAKKFVPRPKIRREGTGDYILHDDGHDDTEKTDATTRRCESYYVPVARRRTCARIFDRPPPSSPYAQHFNLHTRTAY